MGTHYYRLQVTGKYKGGRLTALPFDRFAESNTSNWNKLEERPNEVVYTRDVGCRERVMDFLRDLRSRVFDTSNDDLLVGIRCFGEMHSKVSEIIGENEQNYETLEKLFHKLFGLTYKIRTGKVEQDDANGLHMGTKKKSFMLDGKKTTREFMHYVTVYFRSKGNHQIPLSDAKTSAVLAILRESSLVSGILSGEFSNQKTLCREIIRIAHKRSKGEDGSYDYLGFAGLETTTYSEYSSLLQRIKSYLSGSANTDGSDWENIMWLGVFCYIASCPAEVSGITRITTDSSGPSNYARNNATFNHLKAMAQLMGVRIRTEGLAEKLSQSRLNSDAQERVVRAWRKK